MLLACREPNSANGIFSASIHSTNWYTLIARGHSNLGDRERRRPGSSVFIQQAKG